MWNSEWSIHPVKLRVFDLSKGLANLYGGLFISDKKKGIWHTNVCVFGNEYFYMSTICVCTEGLGWPGEHQFVEEIAIGCTTRTAIDLEAFLRTQQKMFTPDKYDIFRHNCNHFSDLVIRFLIPGRHVPKYILSLPDRVLDSAIGKLIYPFVRSAVETMKSDIKKNGDPLELSGEIFFFGKARPLISEGNQSHLVKKIARELQEEKRRKKEDQKRAERAPRPKRMFTVASTYAQTIEKASIKSRKPQDAGERSQALEKIIKEEMEALRSFFSNSPPMSTSSPISASSHVKIANSSSHAQNSSGTGGVKHATHSGVWVSSLKSDLNASSADPSMLNAFFSASASDSESKSSQGSAEVSVPEVFSRSSNLHGSYSDSHASFKKMGRTVKPQNLRNSDFLYSKCNSSSTIPFVSKRFQSSTSICIKTSNNYASPRKRGISHNTSHAVEVNRSQTSKNGSKREAPSERVYFFSKPQNVSNEHAYGTFPANSTSFWRSNQQSLVCKESNGVISSSESQH